MQYFRENIKAKLATISILFLTAANLIKQSSGLNVISTSLNIQRSPTKSLRNSFALEMSTGTNDSNNILKRRRTFLNHIFLLQLLITLSPVSAALAMINGAKSSSSAEEAICEDPQRVLVIGANGQTGSRVVKILHDDPNKMYNPIAMIRDISQKTKFDTMGVPWIVGDLDDGGAPTIEDVEGVHTVIFAAGAGRSRPPLKKVTIDYLSAVRSIATSQESTTVKRFILLSGINTDPLGTKRSLDATDLSGPLSAWHRLKAHSETYLKESHLHGRSLEWTILCPGRLVDDENGKPGTGLVKTSLIHGEDDLKDSLTQEEKAAAVKSLPGSHDGKVERLCVSRDNVAETIVGLLNAPNTVGKSITVVDGILSVKEALASI